MLGAGRGPDPDAQVGRPVSPAGRPALSDGDLSESSREFRRLRCRAGKTREEWSDRLGIGPTMCHHYERRNATVPEPILRLARMLAGEVRDA